MTGPIEPAATQRWVCLRCGIYRDLPCDHVGPGTPACNHCKLPMTLDEDQSPSPAPPPAENPPELRAVLDINNILDPANVMERED